MKLQRSRTLDTATRDAFWGVVRDTLVDLLGVPPTPANTLTLDRRAGVDFAPIHLKSSIYYHREPFDVASDLAMVHGTPWGRSLVSLADPQVQSAYEVILTRHGLL